MSTSLVVKQITASDTHNLRLKVLRPDHPMIYSHFEGDDGPEAGHFGVYEGDRLLSVGTVVPEPCKDPNADAMMMVPGAWRLRGMATEPDARSKGCGTLVLEACLKHVKKHGGTVLWCNARTGAMKFYERHKFVALSDEYVMPGIGPHYLMKRELK
jgi:predicted GNAT family N-acyltransferase